MQYILDQIADKIGEKLKRKVFQRGGGGNMCALRCVLIFFVYFWVIEFLS